MEYIGIDIAKRKFDVSTTKRVYTFSNSPKGFKQLLEVCKKLGDTHCVCEATGGYEFELAVFLHENNVRVTVVNPKVIKDFFRCIGANAKTDTLDAIGIRTYAERMSDRLKIWKAPPLNIIKLKRCYRRRDDLLSMITQENNRLSSETDSELKKMIENLISSFKTQIRLLETMMKNILKEDSKIKLIYDCIAQIDGCGNITALGIITQLSEIGTMTRGEVAALVGVAPYNNDSGKKNGIRCIRNGRKSLRVKLYMPTITAMGRNEYIKNFAERLLKNGKPFKKVVIACMRKLLIYMNSKVKVLLD